MLMSHINVGRQTGATMIEVLITMVITAIGLLGVASLQTRTYAVESESYQRSQAAILLEDMAARIRANKANAADYVAASLGGGTVEKCVEGGEIAQLDLCQWQNLLRGAAETYDGSNVGAMASARSCITQPDPAVLQFEITVTWEGSVESAAPATQCGLGVYAKDRLRRALTTVVRIPTLS
jgi:type IV pilus assembly protein PilV